MAELNPNDVVSDNSAGFGGLEVIKDCYHLHPIWNSIQGQSSKGGVTSEVQDDAGFGDFEIIKGCYPLHPIWKSIQGQGQSSKGRVTSEVQDAGICLGNNAEASRSEFIFAKHLRKPRNLRRKRKEWQSDFQVICERSVPQGRQSRRPPPRITDIRNLGKLDSEKLEFYLENLWRRFTEEKKNICTYLDSLWFSLYTQGPSKEKVLSWIKRRKVFSKKYVFVPIVQWGHWFLLIFCNFGESLELETKSRCMLLLDSLRKANATQLEPVIRRFVFDIFKTEERPENKELIRKIPLLIPKVPQQKNGEECGFYVLYYIKLFLESAPDNFIFSMDYPHFMKEDWFTPEEVECFVKTLDSMNTVSECSG